VHAQNLEGLDFNSNVTEFLFVMFVLSVLHSLDQLTLVGTYYFRVSMFCSFVEVEGNFVDNSEKLQKLGWTFRPIEETLRDCVESYKGFGLLN